MADTEDKKDYNVTKTTCLSRISLSQHMGLAPRNTIPCIKKIKHFKTRKIYKKKNVASRSR